MQRTVAQVRKTASLIALAAVAETNVFVEAEVGVATFLHSLDVSGADAMILQPH